jgi:signal transduction histidine kinase
MRSSTGGTPDGGTGLDRADDAGAAGHGAPIALIMARAIVAVVLCTYATVALLWVLHLGKDAAGITLAVACLLGLLALQYFYFGAPGTDLRSPNAYVMLAVQATLAYLPMAVFGQAWVGMPSFLGGSLLLVLRPRAAWPAYTGFVAISVVTQWVINGVLLDVVYTMVATATTALYVYGLTRLARLVTALHEARGELARAEVAHERLRFARDLHELLGLSLSTIAPKGELALRLLRRNPEQARRELSEIMNVARRALADVRSIARLYREVPLGEETRTIASMLAASDVDLRVELDLRELPAHTKIAMSALLRECVAYALRQRAVEHCEIVLSEQDGSVRVDIVNDGAVAAPEEGTGGIDDLRSMVSRLAGKLTVDVDTEGRLRLHVVLPVTARPPEEPPGTGRGSATSTPDVATRLAGGLVVAVFTGLFVVAVLRILYETRALWDVAFGTTYLLAALVLQLAYFSRPHARLRSRTGHVLLVVLALVVYLPWLHLQQPWTGLPGFLAGSALLVLRPALGWSVFAAVMATGAWAAIGFGDKALMLTALDILVTLNQGLVTYGLTWMVRTVRRLRAARRELAAAALAETRLRFARDLHDLLGLSLSAITLKSELVHRLIPLVPDRARTELTMVLEISRQALAEVRSMAGGHHEMSLEEECRAAESLLTAAGLNVRMDIDDGADLPPKVGTVLATVLREGVTNVLRHSKAEYCQITIRRSEDGVLLHMVNDGATKPADMDGGGWGSGIRNMSDRAAALGGLLTAQYQGDGRFGLRARLPIPR